jgi:hypothetical protein
LIYIPPHPIICQQRVSSAQHGQNDKVCLQRMKVTARISVRIPTPASLTPPELPVSSRNLAQILADRGAEAIEGQLPAQSFSQSAGPGINSASITNPVENQRAAGAR